MHTREAPMEKLQSPPGHKTPPKTRICISLGLFNFNESQKIKYNNKINSIAKGVHISIPLLLCLIAKKGQRSYSSKNGLRQNLNVAREEHSMFCELSQLKKVEK